VSWKVRLLVEGWERFDAAIDAVGAALAARQSTEVVTIFVTGPVTIH
jgi:hypothetical protein